MDLMARWPIRLLCGMACAASCDYVFRIDQVPLAGDGHGMDVPLVIDAPGSGSNLPGTIQFVGAIGSDSMAANVNMITSPSLAIPEHTFVVVQVGWAGTNTTTINVSDGTAYYTAAGAAVSAAGSLTVNQQTFYRLDVAPTGALHVVVGFGTTVDTPDVRVLAYTGATAVDTYAAAFGNGGLPTVQIVTNNADEVIVAGATLRSASQGSGSGYMQRVTTSYTGSISEDRYAATAGTYAATAPQSTEDGSNYVIQALSFAP